MSERLVTGKKGEELACLYLQDKKYKLETTNYRTRMGEIDLVVWDGDELVFVEVKTSKSQSFCSPEELYSKKQRERLYRMAEHFLTFEEPSKKYSAIRFDFVGIKLLPEDYKITHLKNIEIVY